MIALQIKSGRRSPPLPRLGFRYSDDDPDTTTSTRKTARATTLPRIGLRRPIDNVVRRAPLPRLGYRKPPGLEGKRSLPLPRIGRRARDHWNLEIGIVVFRSFPCKPRRFIASLEPGKRLFHITATCQTRLEYRYDRGKATSSY